MQKLDTMMSMDQETNLYNADKECRSNEVFGRVSGLCKSSLSLLLSCLKQRKMNEVNGSKTILQGTY